MSGNLVFYAGPKAMESIGRHGLKPSMVKAVLAAAGGPKWLVLYGLDRALFSTWFQGRTEPLFLFGASIGAWQFAAVSQSDSSQALDRFLSSYMAQSYSPYPGREEITSECVKICDALLGDRGIEEILAHPFLRMGVFTTHCKWATASENKFLLSLGLVDALLYNLANRRALNFLFERVLFHDRRDAPPLGELTDFTTKTVPLSPANFKDVLMASGAIPLVMEGVKDISGAPAGMYRDGGLIDYNFDLPFLSDSDDGVILFPHYAHRIVPGWFDKRLPWRKPREANVERMLMICPSRSFLESLPHKKISDREDFALFRGRDKERIAYWNQVIEGGKRLADEFLEAVEGGSVGELLRPLSEIM
ncbi:MAG: patatin-like phospholipase family protein [Syntrophobacteraceae bacterium]